MHTVQALPWHLSSSRYSSQSFCLESIMIVYQMIGSIFAFCEIFSDIENISASRWLMKYEHEMSDYKQQDDRISSNKYLSSLNMLLIDEATEWSKSHSDAIRLLNDSSSTHDTIDAFKSLFCDRFSSRVVEIVSVLIDVELAELKQKSNKILTFYYKRMTSLMQRIDVRDRSVQNLHAFEFILFFLKSIMLNIILRAFIRELFESEIRREATREMILSDRSLKIIY
jgi:hypothetical protein